MFGLAVGVGRGHRGGQIALAALAGIRAMPAARLTLPVEYICRYAALVFCLQESFETLQTGQRKPRSKRHWHPHSTQHPGCGPIAYMEYAIAFSDCSLEPYRVECNASERYKWAKEPQWHAMLLADVKSQIHFYCMA